MSRRHADRLFGSCPAPPKLVERDERLNRFCCQQLIVEPESEPRPEFFERAKPLFYVGVVLLNYWLP